MTMIELPDLTIAEIARALRGGQATVVDLIGATLDRIAVRDPQIGAFVSVDGDAALRRAAVLDAELSRGDDRGPMHGIPIGIKDVVAVAGWPTGCGSFAASPRPARVDATAVARLRVAGAIPIGRLATYEYALSGPTFDGPVPPPRNPRDPTRITGGSSSGSAAAVAAGLVRVAVGTDTGGSIRAPAAYCGVVGLKSGRGAIPLDGVHPLSPSLDNVDAIGVTVAEAAVASNIMAARPPHVPSLEGIRIGYGRSWSFDPRTAPELVRRLDETADVFAALGFPVEIVDLPDYAPFETTGATILRAEAWSVHRDAIARNGRSYGAAAREDLLSGSDLTETDLADARRTADALSGHLRSAMADVSVLLLPTTLTPAPPLADFRDGPRWTAMRTIPFNVAGLPAINVPCGTVDGLPVGLQIAGRTGSEAAICAVAAAYEAAAGHAVRRS
ncbi:amidase [Jannaschia sp. LMIT008]|uniref:amidase n=1 Tax=Jannaschia maritima TaxID=3032585 RepID=UPI002811399F|nr:amidase [Jannaschia sp. LMIT008]